ncbi:hypothetical protein M514_04613 [Trichuris suis]|uniref:Uncharacterized protein n=1 Tax=Trichuris suis TaxID=68888 RepID=A0A085NV34_9BILA|nr:hypothetical protein M513_04613 [Trichuris suis]KFD73330.1 hypothetical protein M514_04613 [Trichuris suis]
MAVQWFIRLPATLFSVKLGRTAYCNSIRQASYSMEVKKEHFYALPTLRVDQSLSSWHLPSVGFVSTFARPKMQRISPWTTEQYLDVPSGKGKD